VTEKTSLDPKIKEALTGMGTVDITTLGRKSGNPRRLEIVFHNIGGHVYISGMPSPNRRSWLANLDAHPGFTLHLKRGVKADLPAQARIITAEAERRTVLASVAKNWKRNDVERMVVESPLIEVTLE
jgi:deazaflavin-dependent oxidoreductase (nitroreductase family)